MVFCFFYYSMEVVLHSEYYCVGILKEMNAALLDVMC